MATNLLIGYPEIGLAAAVTTTVAPDPLYPVSNLSGANRTDHFRLPGGGPASVQVQYALPTALSANFFYVGNADWLKGEGVTTVRLARNSVATFSSSTTVSTHALASATLVGTNGSDLLATFAATPAASYWWVDVAKGTSLVGAFSKAFMGTAFDMGSDPDAGVTLRRDRKRGGGQRRALYSVDLSWPGVPYAKAVEFYQKFVRPRRWQPVVLFTTAYDGILDGHKALLCRVTECGFPPRVTGANDISLSVEELL